MFVNGKKSISFKQPFKYQFSSSILSRKHIWASKHVESEEVSSKRNVYNFAVDYDDIDKSDILNIHKYLMVKNNTK